MPIYPAFEFQWIKFDHQGDFDAGYLYECKFVSEEERNTLPEELRDEPLQSVPVTESNDVPITFMHYR